MRAAGETGAQGEGVAVRSEQTIGVAIVDDHVPVRDGLPPLLGRSGVDVVATAPANDAGVEAVLAAPEAAVALVGLGGARRPGLAVARRLGARRPGTAILLLTDGPADLEPASALAAGAAGVLWKGAPIAAWVDAVRAVAGGRLYLDPRDAPAPAPCGAYARLSQRERRVLLELARGASTEEAADRLHLSTHTVRTHLRNIQRKLGARTRVHALALALAGEELSTPERAAVVAD